MKGAQKNNNKMLVLVIILSIILAILVGAAVYLGSDKAKGQSPTTENTAAEDYSATEEPAQQTDTAPQITEPENMDPEDLVVTTPYCNLYYPGQWQDRVRAETEYTAVGCIVTYYGTVGDREEKLFAVFFAESSDDSYPVGTITYEGTMMDVSVALFDIEQFDGLEMPDADTLNAMQEGVNYLLDKLEENPVFNTASQPSHGDTPEETKDITQDLAVSTPYCNLYYPAQWKDAVRYEADETDAGYIVVFYGAVNGKNAELFTIYFAEGSEDSVPIGVYTADGVSMDIGVSMPELPEDNDWSAAERESFYALQEKINYLIDKLREDTAFVPV